MLHTDNNTIPTQALLRLRYYLIHINSYLDNHKSNIIFASSRTEKQPFSYDLNIPLGLPAPLPNNAGNRVVIMVDNDSIEKQYPIHATLLHEISHIHAGAHRIFCFCRATSTLRTLAPS
ncbi:hypothetical protein D8L93_07990 [Sodalis-like symbiont of Bactericera trigonica]|nr:hypothetical protein D8L93_07990 [Sodalis-like symbiont of Bactericera trigonica]